MTKPLEVYEGAVPCVKCGFCCKNAPCGFGEWNAGKGCCCMLVDKKDGTYECEIYEDIIKGEDKSWHIAPAFGAGCCSSVNRDRQALLRRLAHT